MAERRQVDRVVDEFDSDEIAPLRQHDVVDATPLVVGDMVPAFRSIGERLVARIPCADGERERGPEPVCRAHEIADVERFRHALRADGEVAARGRRPGLGE